MKESASNLEFEEAAKIRDEIRKLQSTAANAFTTDKPGGTALQAAITALKAQLNLSTMKSKTVKTV